VGPPAQLFRPVFYRYGRTFQVLDSRDGFNEFFTGKRFSQQLRESLGLDVVCMQMILSAPGVTVLYIDPTRETTLENRCLHSVFLFNQDIRVD